MDLIDYLQSYTKDSKGKPLMRKRAKTKGKQPKRPRRARGYGQRSSKYNSSNNSTFNSNMEKLLTTILAAVTKPNTPSVESLTQGKEFIERDRQVYSQPGTGQKEYFGSIKKPVTQKSTQVTGFDIDRIEQQKAILFNTETDFDMRVENILEKQKELLTHIGSIEKINPEEATRVRRENLKLKEEVLSQTTQIKELLNDAEDLNDMKSLLDKQNKMLQDTTVNFAAIDNVLSKNQADQIGQLTEDIKKSVEEAQKANQAVGVFKRDFEDLVEQAYEKGKQGFQAEVDRDRNERIQDLELELESEQVLVGELGSKLKSFVELTDKQQEQIKSLRVDLFQEQEGYEEEIEEQKQLGILGVLGRDVLAGVRQDISTQKQKKTKGKLRDTKKMLEGAEMELEERGQTIMRGSDLQQKLVKNVTDLSGIVREQQTLGTLQGIREQALSGVRENIGIRKGLRQEILNKQKKGFIDVLKEDKEDLQTLLEREEEAREIREDYVRLMEEDFDLEKATIRKGLGREIVGRKKQQTLQKKLQQERTEGIALAEQGLKQSEEYMELLKRFEKAEQQKANSQAQLRGLKQYADSLNDQLLASGEKGLLSQQQYFDKKIADLENNLAMEKNFSVDMKLKLEKSEEKEQALKQQLREFEDEVDRQAGLELDRVVSGLSDI
jgi:DNA-directed RNA polymerase subunit F